MGPAKILGVCILLMLIYIVEADVIEERVCIGTNGRLSVPSNKQHHYRNLRDRYTNCTYVDGNLEITCLQNETFDLSFLQYIREVTGYVLISHVDVKKIVLPRLQIIRGRTLFKLTIHDIEFALFVTMCQMQNLEMPALRDILNGSVGMYNNYNLCHIRTINWEEIITGPSAMYSYVYNFTSPERACTPCDKSCEQGCWGEGPENCQKYSKTNCSPQCWQAGASGPIRGSVAIFFAPVAAQARNRATASPARTSSMTVCARRNARPCKNTILRRIRGSLILTASTRMAQPA